MKVYYTYFDYSDKLEGSIGSIHKTFRSASQALLELGFEPYCHDGELYFYNAFGYYDEDTAEVVEIDLLD